MSIDTYKETNDKLLLPDVLPIEIVIGVIHIENMNYYELKLIVSNKIKFKLIWNLIQIIEYMEDHDIEISRNIK